MNCALRRSTSKGMKRLSAQIPISLFCLLLVLASCGQAAEGGLPRPNQHDLACPKHPLSPRRLAHINRNSEAVTKTVPGDPDRLLLCRYWGVYQGKDLPEVVEQRFSRVAIVRSLAEQFNHQPPYPRGARACSTGNGGPIYVFFRYEDQPLVVVEVWRDGCKRLWNGHARTLALTPQLEKRLLRLLPLPESRRR
jgi:hypothetical protein